MTPGWELVLQPHLFPRVSGACVALDREGALFHSGRPQQLDVGESICLYDSWWRAAALLPGDDRIVVSGQWSCARASDIEEGTREHRVLCDSWRSVRALTSSPLPSSRF